MPAPKLSTTVAAGEDFNSTDEYAQYIAGIVARSLGEINWILSGNLDVANIKAKSIVTDLISAGAVKADKIDVSELSAISANLGHIIAGLIEGITIIGSLIKTTGTYPRCEMSSTGNLFGAFFDALNGIFIEPDYAGAPSLNFKQGGSVKGRINTLLGYLVFEGVDRDIAFDVPDGHFVKAPSWSKFLNSNSGNTLQYDLDSITSQISSIWTNISNLSDRVAALESGS